MVWSAKQDYIGAENFRKYGQVLCFAAKWLGAGAMIFERRQRTDRDVCRTLHALFGQADIVVAHNGRAFDERHIKARWSFWRLPPPSPYKLVDTCLLARTAFGFPHNSLAGLGRYLRLGGKVEHEGIGLWVRCLDGDAAAWRTMERYNVRDVELLEKVYLRLRAWDKRAPNVGAMIGDGKLRCVVCGSDSLAAMDAPARTAVLSYVAYRCRDCGKISRSRVPRSAPARTVNAL
jgi:hypothetical protein